MAVFSYRSMLFVPAGNARKVERAAASEADALILDWEDATAVAEKASARRATLLYLAGQRCRQPVWVRVNPAGSPPFLDDKDALQQALPHGIVIPKCDSVTAVLHLVALLDHHDSEYTCMLMPLIESASGLLAAPEIARSSPRVAAMGFGAEDFSGDTEVLPGPDGRELLYARSSVVVASRAAGVEPVDSPSLDYSDAVAVENSAREARRLGFSGKMAIHPMQVPAIHEAFTSSANEIEQARALIDAFESQSAGAVAFEGKMVDEAVARRARRLLARGGLH